MNLYQITLYDRFDRELQRIEQHATSMAMALLVSEGRLRCCWGAVSAQVDLVVDEPGFACLVDESAGQAELHSVRSELHEGAPYEGRFADEDRAGGRNTMTRNADADLATPLPRVGGVDLDAVARLEAFAAEEEG